MRLTARILLVLVATSFLFIGLVVAQELAAFDSESSSIRVMTFNIRYNNPKDGEHAWPNRKERVASVVRFHAVDLLGVQEALRGQIEDLQQSLPEFSWIGVGRDDGKDAGEFAPIFYRKDRFELVDNGTFWLSETPELVASKSWDAALTRIASWAKLIDRKTSAGIFFLNTHFDHRGEQARTESARLIVERIEHLADANQVIVTGDFNVPPGAEAYSTMTGFLTDSRLSSQTPPHGPEGTFGGFAVGSTDNADRIDYIFVDPSIQVYRHGNLSDQWDGDYPSDHLPVLSEIQLVRSGDKLWHE